MAVEQNEDGGWPAFWSEGRSSLDATCFRLDVETLDADDRERALDFLTRGRLADGSWQEAADLAADAPPWVRPRDPNATAYLTWNVALTLAKAGRLDESPRIPPSGFLQTHWLAAATLLRLHDVEAAGASLAVVEARLDEVDEEGRAWIRRSMQGLEIDGRYPRLRSLLGQANNSA